GGNVRIDRRHDRRALSLAELGRLLESARDSAAKFRGLTGADRVMLYTAAMTTGLRADELASLTPASFDLSTSPPTATVQAGYAESGRMAVQPLPLAVAVALGVYLAGKRADCPVWPGTWPLKAAKMIRVDLVPAEIPYKVQGQSGPLYAD